MKPLRSGIPPAYSRCPTRSFPFPQAFLGPDRMVVTGEDDLRLTSVVVYRILR